MARKRQIDPEYPFEEEIARLSIPARYFYIMSWCHMDDTNGVLPYNAYKLKGQIFPEDGIDIEELIQELIDMHRLFVFEAEGKRWLWCPKLLKHQVINHPSRKRYPDPPKTLQEDYRSSKVALTLSRVELSRVELKDQPNPAALSINTKDLLNTVFNKGVNIYQCLEKFKKQYHKYPPEDCIVKVCNLYMRQPDKIKDEWPWFITSMAQAMKDWHAAQNQAEASKLKKAPIIQSIKEIMINAVKETKK